MIKAGAVGVMGPPNAGKSSLINNIIGEKVGIVSPKPQTTRQRVVGIYSDEETQILFVDPPGQIEAEKGLNSFLQKEYEDVLNDVDVVVLTINVDAKKPEVFDPVIAQVVESGKPWLAVVTKTDLPNSHRKFYWQQRLSAYNVPVFGISNEKSSAESKTELLDKLKELLPESKSPFYDPELYTTQNMRQLAAEIIREKSFVCLSQEVPYGLAVRITKFDETQARTTKIFAELIVARESHVPIVLGSGGSLIKKIGTLARKELEEVFQQKIYLNLFVKVKKDWTKNPQLMKELGYAVNERSK